MAEERRVWRPLGVRLAGAFFSVVLVLVTTMAWFGFDESIRDRFTLPQKVTVLLMGAGLVGVAYGLGRSRIVVAGERVEVINFFRRHRLERAQVITVRLPRGAPWAIMDLNDGSTLGVMGIQNADGGRALRAVREVRAALDV